LEITDRFQNMNLCALCGFSQLPVGLLGLFGASAPHPIVHVNAGLNLAATILLLVGLVLIHQRREAAHKRVMLAAFGVSTLFLACYVWYHANFGSVKFMHTGPIKAVYLSILSSHILLAATVPFLAIITIVLGCKALGSEAAETALLYRLRHRRLARWTFPIWLYVSVTGVVVYVMLYHVYPPKLE
jgi:uncharacterized membrane protein YozB (DUF420 family)